MSVTSRNVLFVRHLPNKLSNEEKRDLLMHFGATDVRLVLRKGKREVAAFAIFPNENQARFGMANLHQLEVVGSRLVVEFAAEKHDAHYSAMQNSEKEVSTNNQEKSDKKKIADEMKDFHRKLQACAPQFNINHPLSPSVKYLYPPPTNVIISNIAHSLMSVPKFYNQVLHLMNKMNLPPPFGNLTPVPPVRIEEEHPPRMQNEVTQETMPTQWTGEEEMLTSETESELESDADDTPRQKIELPKKRPAKSKVQRLVKKEKLGNILPQTRCDPNKTVTPSDVFEMPEAAKKVNLKITTVAKSTEPSVQPEPMTSGGGFGTFAPTLLPKDDDDDEGRKSPESTDYIRSSELKANRISKNDMKTLPIFKNYETGLPTTRLYIKNIAKTVEEEDIKFIFRRYVKMKVEEERNMFDVRLMTEGRMKGQAFVTLPNQARAEMAVKETNGYILKDKPLIVQFARSLKAKENKLLP